MKTIARNLKVIIIIAFILETIGWVARGGGKYDQMNLRLGGFEAEQFSVGDNNEQIEVRLNISGRNWELDFDEEDGLILVSKDGETILEGWFIASEDFGLWEDDFLHIEQYAVIQTDSESPHRFYFCSADGGRYVFLRTCLKSSEQKAKESEDSHLQRRTKGSLTVFPKAAVFVKPSKSALNNPAHG